MLSEDFYIKLAYAEDENLLRTTLVEFLENLGGVRFTIQAENGKELIEKISQAEEKPDVCLVDIRMCKMDGFDTVVEIKKKWADIKVLALSGYSREEYLIRMVLCGADGYLTKNVHPREVLNAVRSVYEYGFYNTELLTPRFVSEVHNRRKTLPELSAKEIQLLECSILDKTYDEIATVMNLTRKSVEGHRTRLFQKIGVRTRAGLTMYAVRHGYVSLEAGIKNI